MLGSDSQEFILPQKPDRLGELGVDEEGVGQWRRYFRQGGTLKGAIAQQAVQLSKAVVVAGNTDEEALPVLPSEVNAEQRLNALPAAVLHEFSGAGSVVDVRQRQCPDAPLFGCQHQLLRRQGSVAQTEIRMTIEVHGFCASLVGKIEF